MRVIYINGLDEEINSEVLAEFTYQQFPGVSDSPIVQMIVVRDRIGNPVMIEREAAFLWL